MLCTSSSSIYSWMKRAKCLASIAEKNGTRYLLITAHAPVSNTPYHILDAAHIYDYFYEYYARQTVLTADQILLETKVPFVLFNNKLSLSAGSDIVLNLPKTLDLSTLLIETNWIRIFRRRSRKDSVWEPVKISPPRILKRPRC